MRRRRRQELLCRVAPSPPSHVLAGAFSGESPEKEFCIFGGLSSHHLPSPILHSFPTERRWIHFIISNLRRMELRDGGKRYLQV
ncbi:hypothetical protein PTI98_007170 [Pleurotus ostreatus]|nr:hypothetical protein PTI98_007170 [Pleurotus ostreatus]